MTLLKVVDHAGQKAWINPALIVEVRATECEGPIDVDGLRGKYILVSATALGGVGSTIYLMKRDLSTWNVDPTTPWTWDDVERVVKAISLHGTPGGVS